MWTPNYNQTRPFIRGKGGLLNSALCSLRRLTRAEKIKDLKDDIGIYAIELVGHILAAKKSPYGNIVSVNEKVVNLAIKKQKKVLLYIDDSKFFYEFNPEYIKNGKKNTRGDGQVMINFPIDLGANYIKRIARENGIEAKNILAAGRELREKRMLI